MRGPSSIGSGRLEEAMVKEAIFELRKQPEGQYGQFQPGGVPKKTKDEAAAKRIASTIGTTSPQSAALQSAPTSESKKYSTELTGQTAGVPQKKTTTETVENVRGTMTGTPDETAPGMPGAGGVRRLYSVESKPKGFDSTDVSQIAATSGAGRKGIQARADFDPADIGSMGAPTRAATSAEVAEREKGKDTGPAAPTETTKLVGRPDVDEDVIEGRSSGTLPPDTSNENLVVGGPDDGGLKGEDDKINTAATSATATGFTPTKDRPAIPETEQTIKNNRAGTPAPLINSSGYYSAVVQIGELTAENATAEQRNLALKNYGVKSLSEFLDLYKAVTPKSITAKPKANVTGVNMSSTVVSGAGTMQKGKIKAERSVPARTRPKKRVPKLIKSERPAMDNTLRYIIKEAIEEMQIEKAPKKGRNLPSKGRQFSQTDADTGRGATSFIQERKKSRDMGSRLGPQRKETGKATGGSAEGYRGYISNMAKQALIKKGMVWDVRNHNWVSIEKQESDVDTFSSRRLNYSDPSKPDTRMSDTGPDEYGDSSKYIPTPMRDVGPQKINRPKLNRRPEVYRGE